MNFFYLRALTFAPVVGLLVLSQASADEKRAEIAIRDRDGAIFVAIHVEVNERGVREVQLCGAVEDRAQTFHEDCSKRRLLELTSGSAILRLHASDFKNGDKIPYLSVRYFLDGTLKSELIVRIEDAKEAPYFLEVLKILLGVIVGGSVSIVTHFLFQAFERRRAKSDSQDRDRSGAAFILKLIQSRALELLPSARAQAHRSQLLTSADIEKNVGAASYVRFSKKIDEAIETALAFLRGGKHQVEFTGAIERLIREINDISL